MKRKISFVLILLFIVLTFYSFNNPTNKSYLSGSSQRSFSLDSHFMFSAMQTATNSGFYLLDSLKFNMYHRYLYHYYHGGYKRHIPSWSSYDDLFSNINDYRSSVRQVLDSTRNHNMGAILHRPKIDWLCYGQRSDYQCDSIPKIPENQWFYSFQEHSVGTDISDSNATVRYCNTAMNNSGWVVRKLKANTEQSNPDSTHGDAECKWFIKPRMRISSSVDSNTKVCQIVVLNEVRDTTLKKDIYAKNFRKNGSYSGQYVEEYSFLSGDTTKLTVNGKWGNNYWYCARGDKADSNIVNHSDIQVYWYDNCDMWIDYVRVDDDIANDLFSPTTNPTMHNLYKDWLEWEASEIACYSGNAYRVYLELFEYNNVPCMSYVSKKLDSIAFANCGKHISLMCIPIPSFYTFHVPMEERFSVESKVHFKKYFLDKMAAPDFLLASYPFNSSYVRPELYTTSNTWSRIPNTLPVNSGNGTLAPAVSPSSYDSWLQSYFDTAPTSYEIGGPEPNWENEPGHFTYTMKRGDSLSKMTNTSFLFNAQAHIWKLSPNITKDTLPHHPGEVQREPTNEEFDLTTNLAIAYGSRGIIYFEYPTITDSAYGDPFYDRGIAEFNGQPRYTNIYGQPKWEKIKSIGSRIKKWEPYVMSFDNANRHSYIYRLEKTAMLSETFINDLKSFKNSSISDDIEEESSSERYLQASVFNNDSTDTRYFMIVNRRCSPISSGNPDGQRKVQIKFNANSSSFGTFDNWKIIDLETDAEILTFDKTVSSYLDLGWFNPGQGKLYKVVPVMKTGGTFVTSEYLNDISFNCNGTVNTNGHNLTIAEGVNISFAENAQIRMKKGEFLSGIDLESDGGGIEQSYLKAQNGSTWNGIYFDSTDVDMGYVTIKDVKKDATTNSGYVLNFINCDTVMVERTYITTTDSAGCINIYYSSGGVTNPVVNLLYDSLNVNIAGNPPLNIYTVSSLSGDFAAEHNVIKNFNTSGGGIGVNIFGMNHFFFNDNLIRSFAKAIYSIHTSPDLWANVVSGGAYGGYAYSLMGESSTIFDLSSDVGGFNSITMFSGECIKLDDSYVDIHNGGNYFNVYDTLGYHLRGYFPVDIPSTNEDGRGNCFILRDVVKDSAHARISVTLGDLTPVHYRLLPFASGCNPADNSKVNIAEDNLQSKQLKKIKDNSPVETNIAKTPGTLTAIDDAEAKILESRELHSQMKKALKANDYNAASEKSRQILELGIENMYTVDAVRKLFHCTAMSKDKSSQKNSSTSINTVTNDAKVKTGKVTKQTDAGREKNRTVQNNYTANSMSDLKSYYETYIQSHPGNNAIINEMFYFIQKCKINLGDYESALNGYKAIMERNPSSIAGLSAKWEYSDLQLLVSSKTNGTGGAENQLTINNEQLTDEQKHVRLIQLVEDMQEGPKDGPRDGKDKYDKKKFTAEDRKVITNNIVNTLESNDRNDKTRLKSLEEKVINNQADATETSEYKKRLLLKELIKTQKINNINEQIAMIDTDLRRIFSLDQPAGNEQQSRTSPEVAFDYKLNQNYPNPFNPSTKINYELKNTGYVSLKIYDLLGREIAELVNETKDAGRYSIDFNASKYMMASGIYFYRIKAGEFVDTKRMVLVK